MKLGILTAPFPETPLAEVAGWASSAGFQTLEVACWPKSTGPSRRYAGTTHIDVAKLSASEAKEIVPSLAENNVSISALAYYPNPLHPDRAHRETVIGHLKKVIEAAGKMGVCLVTTVCGGAASQHVDANWQ